MVLAGTHMGSADGDCVAKEFTYLECVNCSRKIVVMAEEKGKSCWLENNI